jgi:hypothetical protein
MTSLINRIINKLNLEKKLENISVVDSIKIELNNTKLTTILQNHKNPTEIEKYIIKLYSSKEQHDILLLSNNYFENLLLLVYFTIGNPFSLDTVYFDAIYTNYKIIREIPNYIKNQYETLLNCDLYRFYNIDIINRWFETVMLKPVKKSEYFKVSRLTTSKKNSNWKKYGIVWKEFNDSCIELKKYLHRLIEYYNKCPYTKIVGCYNVCKKLYLHCLKIHVGINFTNSSIDKLEAWAFKELKILKNRMKQCILDIMNRGSTNKSLNKSLNKSFDVIKKLKSLSKSQRFTSKKEYIDFYLASMEKYEKIFIDRLKFPQYIKPTLIVFSNKNLGQAYYNENCFYLNCYNWEKSYKYTVESLVLHETIPGHHTQVHVSKYIDQPNAILLSYFCSLTNSFVEGWGLWSEQLGYNQTTWDKIGQIEFETFRTLRIIVDIRLHYRGYTPQKMIEFMSKHLAMDVHEIENEVYRYVCYPGQAVSYKIGCTFFKKILDKNNIVDRLDPKALAIYKKLIVNGAQPLCFVMKEYNIKINDLFN